jgi:hypothetical protein
MKRLLSGIFLYLLICAGLLVINVRHATAQVDTLPNPGQYLYTEFTKARVATKVGSDLNMLANYNIVTEMMVFLQKGKVYDLIDYHNVDTIYFKNATYIPGEKVFYEVAVSGPASLLIRHMGTIQDPPKPAAYGGTSEVSSSNYINNLQIGGNTYRLKQDTALIIKQSEAFFIGKGEEVIPFRTEKQFVTIFPGIRNELKSYIKQNKIHFEQEADLVKLVKFCNTTGK